MRRCAPSFLDIADADDRLIVVHSFSKSFLMTGWRLGWLVVPPGAAPAFAKLIEFNTSCAPVFVQRAGLAALDQATSFVPGLVERLRECRDTLLPRLREVARGAGRDAARRPLCVLSRARRARIRSRSRSASSQDAGVGIAPGAAFGA